MSPALTWGCLLILAASGSMVPLREEASRDAQHRFAEKVYQALAEPEDSRLESVLETAPYRAVPLVHDLLLQASRSGMDPRVLQAARRIAALLADRFGNDHSLEAVRRFESYDDEDRRERIDFESAIAEGGAAGQQGLGAESIELGRKALEISSHLNEEYLTARACRFLGEIEGRRGETGRARELLLRAAAIDEALQLEVQLGWDYALIGNLDFEQGRYASSLEWYGRALDKAAVAGEIELEGSLLTNCGAVYSYLGRYDEAERSLSAALDTSRSIGDPAGEAQALAIQGTLESACGDYARSIMRLLDSVQAWKAARDPAGEARTLIHLAGVYSELGQSADAEHAIENALILLPEDRHPADRGRALTALGLTKLDAGAPRQALEPLNRALALLHGAGDRAGAVQAMQHKATSLLRLGEAPEAERLFAKALGLCGDLGDAYGSVLALTGQGDASRIQGRHDRAAAAYRKALAEAQVLGIPELFWRARYGLGLIAESDGRIAEAIRLYQEAVREVESVRKLLTAPSLRQRYLGDKLSLYRRAARLLAIRDRLAAAFRLAEEGKARTLLELAALRPPDDSARGGFPGEAFADLRRSEANLHLLELRLAEFSREGRPAEERADLEARLRHARADHEAARLQLELASPRSASLTGLVAPPSLEEVQSALPGDAALLEYIVGPEGSAVFVVKHDSTGFVELDGSEQLIAEWVARIHHPIERLRKGEIDLANLHFDAKAAAALHETLIAPLEDEISRCRHLWIVPDGPLRKLPFSLLVSRREKRPVDPGLLFSQYTGCRFLIEDFVIATVPIAGLLAYRPDPLPADSHGAGAIVMADPRPTPDEAGFLQATRDEAAVIRRHIGPARSRVMTGSDARESVIKSPGFLSKPADLDTLFIHLACHASLNDRRPAYSRLALAPGQGEDGWLHSYEIERFSLEAPCVVLSACETIGSAGRGEGLLGLSRAFLQAGAHAVVATAWVVDDEATATLMDHFYASIAAGIPPVQALRNSQVALLRSGRREGLLLVHPFFWAGFVYMGGS